MLLTSKSVLYEDEDLIVVKKPAGVDSQAAKGFGADMVSLLQNYLVKKARKENQKIQMPPYIGVIHRLDKPVSGIMVYAKRKEAAARLSEALQKKDVKKVYYACLDKRPEQAEGTDVIFYTDMLLQDKKTNTSRVVLAGTKDAKEARLSFAVLKEEEAQKTAMALGWEKVLQKDSDRVIVKIDLLTGRHHQIRVQFASHGTPLVGDMRYGGIKEEKEVLCLASCELHFTHPFTGKKLDFYSL